MYRNTLKKKEVCNYFYCDVSYKEGVSSVTEESTTVWLDKLLIIYLFIALTFPCTSGALFLFYQKTFFQETVLLIHLLLWPVHKTSKFLFRLLLL